MNEVRQGLGRSWAMAAGFMAAWLPIAAGASTPPLSVKPVVSKPQMVATMMKAQLQFEANHGQVDAQVKFLSRGSGYTLFLTPTESVMVLQQREAAPPANDIHDPLATMEPAPIRQSVVRMKLEGANPSPAIDGMEQLPGIVNYFIGNDPEKWRTKIPTYAKVQYKEAYPGIDLAYYGNQGKLEYDFIVAPGADPSQIKLAFEGASDIRVAASGDLVLTTALGDVRVQKPIVYQVEKDGHKTLVAGNYTVRPQGPKEVGVQVASYDAEKPLIIDPVLIYSSYIGGTGVDQATDVAVDASGNAWVAGWGPALSLSPTGTPYDTTFNGGPFDVWVLKVSPSGTLLVWTYLGGPGSDNTPNIAMDGLGNVWVAGVAGAGFPTTPGSIQPLSAGSSDAFVSKLDPNASALLYSTLYGTSGAEGARSLAVDAIGSIVHIAGVTSSLSPLPGISGAVVQPVYGGGAQDGFIAKLNVATGSVVYATYLGGTNRDDLWKIRVDAAGNAHVAGETQSTDFPGTALSAIPALASFQPVFGGGSRDVFVTKLNPTGTQLIYSTYLGGNEGANTEIGRGLALDSAGQAVVSGNTSATNFPIAGTPFQSAPVGHDYFITKINTAGSALVFSTFIGGNGNDFGSVIALDPSDNIYVTGPTTSCRWPANPHPLQLDSCGASAPFNQVPVAKLNPTGSSLLSLFLFKGTSGIGNGQGIAADGSGNIYVAGLTRASDFTTLNAFQPASAGGPDDGFVAKISDKPTANAGPDQSVPMGTLVTLDGTASTGGSLTYIWTQVAGPTVALSGATTVHPTFSAPTVPAAGGTATFDLVVCEGPSSNCSDPDTVNVHITNVNRPPVAQAGPDQTVQEGSPVMLDGTASYDPDVEPVTYQWTQILGPAVTLVNPTSATPFFSAPSVGSAGATIVFDLTVTDARNLTGSDSLSVFVTNINQAPTANAGPDQTKNELTLVTLNGGGSSDPDLDALSYTWAQTSGPTVALTGATTPSPTFTAPEVGPGGALMTFQLTVHDGHVSSAADTVQIVIQNVNDLPVCTAAKAKPKLLWPPNHKMMKVKIRGISQGTSRHDDDEEEDHQDGTDDHDGDDVQITITSVTQDEPVNGLGDGDTSPDAAVSGNHVLLRAERAGNGNGRVYEVHFTATKGPGGSCSGTVKVQVPRNKKDTAVDSGQLFNSFGP